MDINRLNEFITLAEHLNYSKAAAQLFLTQPSLSRHIHDLEKTLGARLFVRDTHSVSLTEAGKLFYPEAKEIMKHYQHAVASVRDLAASAGGNLSIGFLGAASQPFFTGFVADFTQHYPNINLTLQCGDLDPLAKQLLDGDLDICFITHVDSSFFSGLQSDFILHDGLMIALSPSHPLADRERLTLEDLSGLPAIAFSMQSNPITRDFHIQMFKKAGLHYNISCETADVETALFFVRLNKGYFILPRHLTFMAEDLPHIPLYTADGKRCVIPLNLLWKKDNENPSL
ncbi:MAG: LysR family transcriptional regulator [Clostridiales bacterium]|nr:LysR family transcriptional regulator [Clostridiales bacterium]